MNRRDFIKAGLILAPASAFAGFPPGRNVAAFAAKPAVAGGGGGGSGGNAFTFVQSKANGSATTTGLTLNANTGTGNLLLVFIKWEGSGTVDTLTHNGVSLEKLIVSDHSGGEPHGCWFWCITTGAATAINLTGTTGTVTFMRLIAWEFSASGTIAVDAQGAAAFGTSTSLVSGSASSSVTTGLAVCGYGEYTSTTLTNMQIGGNAATGSLIYNTSSAASWYYLFSGAALSSAAGTATVPNNRWVAPFVIFKAT